MNFTKIEGFDLINGTSLQGFVVAKFKDLVDVFGEPNAEYDEKVDVEWRIQFEDGKVATIYNYKTNGIPHQKYEWHIGSTHEDGELVTYRVKELLERNK